MLASKGSIKSVIIFIFIAFIGLFGYIKTSDIISGPLILIQTPTAGAIFNEPFITVTGRVERIARLYLNDNQIFTDDNGNFNVSLLLLPGYNILRLRAEDNFERQITKTLELVAKN